MGPVAETDLSLGMKPGGLIRFSRPEEIADAIVAAVEKPRAEVWVPRSLRAAVTATNLLPWRARQLALRALGVLDIATQIDREARSDYEERLMAPVHAEEELSTRHTRD